MLYVFSLGTNRTHNVSIIRFIAHLEKTVSKQTFWRGLSLMADKQRVLNTYEP